MMQRIAFSDVKDLVEYEKVREGMRARVIEHKKSRRISLSEQLCLLFENSETVLFQIQEMVRTERIVEKSKIQDEIDAYNALIPGEGELSATLFIEIPDLVQMETDEVRRTVNRFMGLDRAGVLSLRVGSQRVDARFEEGHSSEEKMAAVHYVRFVVPQGVREVLDDPSVDARFVVDHPHCAAQAPIPPSLRAELLKDLAS